ncbi:MAG: hypothetical protein H0W29_02120, partial [Gemmatimonadales bacterium]|nr:hypothetical protein [Gemmatimonadales bacterium]
MLYTLAGDSRVYRHTLSSDLVQVTHDFGAAGIARDVHLVGNRLAAGTAVALDAPGLLYRRPAISPGGGAIAAEGFPLIITALRPGVADTTVS